MFVKVLDSNVALSAKTWTQFHRAVYKHKVSLKQKNPCPVRAMVVHDVGMEL